MLLHIRPQLLSPFRNVTLIDLDIEPLDIHLVGGRDLRTGRPYRNKYYAVACRKQGHKAMEGILIEAKAFVDEFHYTARWAIEAEFAVTHRVHYRVLDKEFDAASDSMILWHRCCEELGGWSSRFPQRAEKTVPMVTEPVMEVEPETVDPRRQSKDVVEAGWIVSRHECFAMPTIERERVLQTRLGQRIPPAEMVFRLK